MKRTSAVLLALALAVPAAAATQGPSAQAVLKRVANEGGRKVLWDLWDQEEKFDQVMAGIESGEPSWLKVAVALKPFADGGASLSIKYSVARVLPRAPERVLALTRQGFEVDDICTSPFLEPDPGVAEAYERETLKALAKVKDPSLVPIAVECAKQVRLPPM